MNGRSSIRSALTLALADPAVTIKNLIFWLRAVSSPPARNALSKLFDERYYLSTYEDVRQSGTHPFIHFLLRGFIERRNPSEEFDTAHYFALYPDVKRSRINPMLHYALFGTRERRSATPLRTNVIEIVSPQSAPDPGVPRIDNAWPDDCPLVSVVIPCYNYGRYIQEALDSVFAQTFQNFEILIVEGGSTDTITPGTVAAIDARRYPNVRCIYRTARALAGDNRNFGISHARGRYICCLDADDILHPIYLEMTVFLAEAYGYDIVSSSVQCFGGSQFQSLLDDPTFPAIAENNSVSTAAMFRRDAWVKAGGFRDWGLGRQHIPEDWDFWLRLLALGYRAKGIREPLLNYRVHGEGLTATAKTHRKEQREVLRKANAAVLDNPVTLPRSMVVEIRNRWANLGPQRNPPRCVLIAVPYLSGSNRDHSMETAIERLVTAGFRVVVITTDTPPDEVREPPDRYNRLTKYVYHLPKLLPARSWDDFVRYLLRRYQAIGLWVAGSDLFTGRLDEIRTRFPGILIVDRPSANMPEEAIYELFSGLVA